MSTHRIKRIQEEIQHAVSSILLLEVTDPLLRTVTVTRALVTKDLSLARIYYDAPGGDQEKIKVQEALLRARGFIRKQLAQRLRVKAMPELEFFYDETREEISRVEELFSKL